MEGFAAIVNPPQSLILAVGSAVLEPTVADGQLAVASVAHLTLSAITAPSTELLRPTGRRSS